VKEIPASKAYRFLESGPVMLVTPAHRDRRNMMAVALR
jgi:hypothetical protein